MLYQPNALVLTLSRKCNLKCEHCIVEAEPRLTERLDIRLINRILPQAKLHGINSVLIYGGEPFLFVRDLLPQTLDSIYQAGFMDVQIGTNGFWGHSDEQAKKTLEEMEEIAGQEDNFLNLVLSIDQYHQPRIPPKSLANIIKQFRLGDFRHLNLGVQTFRTQESLDAVGEVYAQCWMNGICLVESNNQGYMYPAMKEEFVRFIGANYHLIRSKLSLPEDADEKQILRSITQYLDIANATNGTISPNIIAREIDIGDGLGNYLIFPNKRYYIDFLVERKVLNAGRARRAGRLETGPDESDLSLLVISPNGQAYAYPAQMTAQEGVPIGYKPLNQVIWEVGNMLT